MPRDHKRVRIAVRKMVDAINEHFQRSTDEDLFILHEVAKTLVWKYTEALPGSGPKYFKCRIWSRGGAFDSYIQSGTRDLEIDHVVSRAWIKDQLLAEDALERLECILKELELCVVTADEHRKLPKDEFGWDRYRKNEIKVAPLDEQTRQAMARARNRANRRASCVSGRQFDWRVPID